MLKTSCLINNYNYGEFVCEAIASAARQTVEMDEIVVVDDGSTDDSRQRIRRQWGSDPRVQLIAKANAGQLSCFNAGLAHCTGDLLFFLDADDLFAPRYVETALEYYDSWPDIDVLLMGHERFGQVEDPPTRRRPDCDCGYSVVMTWHTRMWLGAPTSCISMRRSLAEQILPVPFERDWKTRADDCLVFGSSLAGGRKFRCSEPLVRYRMHANNCFAGGARDKYRNFRRDLAIARLFDHYRQKTGFSPEFLAEFAHHEFSTIAAPPLRYLWRYASVALGSRARWSRKVAMLGAMMGHYVASRNIARRPSKAVQHQVGGRGRPSHRRLVGALDKVA